MSDLHRLLDQNRAWANTIKMREPDFFSTLAQQQQPQYLWIGCSDSRVPANQIIGLRPGEVFVHRNIANVVVHTDLNCLSTIQFAVDVLRVHDVIVCGHYGCTGVNAALEGRRLGLADNWLRHVEDVRDQHADALAGLSGTEARWDRLCELNVIEQVLHVTQTTVLREAWSRGQEITVHGWIYSLRDGRLRDLTVSAASPAEAATAYTVATRAGVRRP